MRRFSAHLAAIVLSVIALLGALSLPAVNSFSLPSLFTLFWLSLAVLALLAQMRRAKLLSSARQRPSEHRVMPERKRSV